MKMKDLEEVIEKPNLPLLREEHNTWKDLRVHMLLPRYGRTLGKPSWKLPILNSLHSSVASLANSGPMGLLPTAYMVTPSILRSSEALTTSSKASMGCAPQVKITPIFLTPRRGLSMGYPLGFWNIARMRFNALATFGGDPRMFI